MTGRNPSDSAGSEVTRDRPAVNNADSGCCGTASVLQTGISAGAFLASGSISDPNRFYHLEIVCPDAPRAEQVQELLKNFGIDARIVLGKTTMWFI